MVVENVEEEEIEERPNPDEEYDKWREREAEELELELKGLMQKWCVDRPGYYNGCKEKFVEHTISTLKELNGG